MGLNADWSNTTFAFIGDAEAVIRLVGDDDVLGVLLAEGLVARHLNSPLALRILGHAYTVRARAEDALPPLLRAAELAPRCPGNSVALAVAHTSARQFDLASQECGSALAVDNPTDPALHSPYLKADIDLVLQSSTLRQRVAVSREELRWIRANAEKNIGVVDAVVVPKRPPASPSSIVCARARWNGMSSKERNGFLSVSFEEMKQYYSSGVASSEQRQTRVLSDAAEFVKDAEVWTYWLCPECSMIYLNADAFMSHVKKKHIDEGERAWPPMPERIDDEDMKLLGSYKWEPFDKEERDNIVSKIKEILLQLNDWKAISVVLQRFIRTQVGGAIIFGSLDWISLLHSADLQTLQTLHRSLELLQPRPIVWEHEKGHGGEQDSEDSFDVITLDRDAWTLSLDIKKIASRNTDGSSEADVLFDWLFRRLLQDKPKCVDHGTDILNKMNEAWKFFLRLIKLRDEHSELSGRDNFTTQIDNVNIHILQTDAEVDYLKKKFLEVCCLDYRAVVLPVMKAYLWTKLNNDFSWEALHDENDKGTMENLRDINGLNVFNEKIKEFNVQDQELSQASCSVKQLELHQEAGKQLEANGSITKMEKHVLNPPASMAEDTDKQAENEILENNSTKIEHNLLNLPTSMAEGAERQAANEILDNNSVTEMDNNLLNPPKSLAEDAGKQAAKLSEILDDNSMTKMEENLLNQPTRMTEDADKQTANLGEALGNDSMSKMEKNLLNPRTGMAEDDEKQAANLADSKNSQDKINVQKNTSDLSSDLNYQASMTEENKAYPFSNCSGPSTKEAENVSSHRGVGIVPENTSDELRLFLNVVLRSLWHLRQFCAELQKMSHVCPHFTFVGDHCIVCLLYKIFCSWDNKEDCKAAVLLDSMEAAFSNILNDGNVCWKVENNIASGIIALLFEKLHTSQTSFLFNCNTGTLKHRVVYMSSCSGICLPHNLFGMHINEQKKCTCLSEFCYENEYTTFFHNLDAGAIQITRMKSFDELLKSGDKQFYCDIESGGCGNKIDRSISDPPHFFTTVFIWPNDEKCHINMSEVLINIAAPLDISLLYEGVHSESMYTLVSAVCYAEKQYLCFACEGERWLIYDGKTFEAADSWQNLLHRYSQSRLHPDILFFERIS